MRGGFLLLLPHSGAFHLRSSHHELVVDPTVSILGRAGEPADIAHPYGQGDCATYIVLSPEAFEALAGSDAAVPGLAPATGRVVLLHQHLLRLLAPHTSWMAVEDAAMRVFAAALAGSDSQPPGIPSIGSRRQEQIVDDTCGVLADDPTIDSLVHLGHVVGCSPHHLSRLFHQRMGKTLVRHRWELRIHRALQQIRDPELTVAQVAAESGFADQAHLTRSVRRFLGVTPSQLRSAE
jgi:AraC-like DNA-binding protein